jgi:hypothetical protein
MTNSKPKASRLSSSSLQHKDKTHKQLEKKDPRVYRCQVREKSPKDTSLLSDASLDTDSHASGWNSGQNSEPDDVMEVDEVREVLVVLINT